MNEDETMYCADCGEPIVEGGLYLKQTDGSVLCENCYKERIWLN